MNKIGELIDRHPVADRIVAGITAAALLIGAGIAAAEVYEGLTPNYQNVEFIDLNGSNQ